MAINKRIVTPSKCQVCPAWIKRGGYVFKWWPGPEERGVYPAVWACYACWKQLCDNKIKPKPLHESVEEVREAREALEKMPAPPPPVELPTGVVAPLRKSPMSSRR